MRKDYEELFTSLDQIEPPSNFLPRIMGRIRAEKGMAVLKIRLVAFSFGAVFSLLVIAPIFNMMRSAIFESGFSEFFSLIFSDILVVAAHPQNFLMTLLETVPTLSVAAFLAAVLACLMSFKFLVKDAQTFFAYRHSVNN